jgi:hypothetical protein
MGINMPSIALKRNDFIVLELDAFSIFQDYVPFNVPVKILQKMDTLCFCSPDRQKYKKLMENCLLKDRPIFLSSYFQFQTI